jgi:hypothetical protein
MAVANRQHGKNLNLFTVAGNALVNVIADATIDLSYSMVDGQFLNDPATANVSNRQDYRISFTVAYDDGDAGISALINAVGTAVTFSVTASASGENYAGTGILSTGSHSIPDGGQQISFEIVPNGTVLTVT